MRTIHIYCCGTNLAKTLKRVHTQHDVTSRKRPQTNEKPLRRRTTCYLCIRPNSSSFVFSKLAVSNKIHKKILKNHPNAYVLPRLASATTFIPPTLASRITENNNDIIVVVVIEINGGKKRINKRTRVENVV